MKHDMDSLIQKQEALLEIKFQGIDQTQVSETTEFLRLI